MSALFILADIDEDTPSLGNALLIDQLGPSLSFEFQGREAWGEYSGRIGSSGNEHR